VVEATAQTPTRRRGRLNGNKRAADRRIVQIATARGRGYPHIAPNVDSRHLIERLASWVYICIERNATEVSQHALRLYSASKTPARSGKALTTAERKYLKTVVPQRITREAVELEDHLFLDLLDYVNPILDACGLFWLTTAYLQLEGNAYWHVAVNGLGTPIEVWPLPAQYIFPILGTDNVIDKYQLRYIANVVEFPADEIVHFRQPSPLDMISGLGNLKGILFAAETNLRMQEWENAFFTNYAMPDFILAPKGDISEAQQKQLSADWDNEYGGWRNRGKMAVAPVSMKVERLTMTAKEMQFEKGRRAILEEIAAGIGVPINIVTVDGITFNNMRHGLSLWMRSRIKPIQKVIASTINTYMMPRYTGGTGIEEPLRKRSPLFVAFDNPVPEDVDADAERLMKLSGGVPLVTPNEGRAELGREPVEWGEEPMIPGGMRKPSEPIAGAQFPDGMQAGEQQPAEGETAAGEPVEEKPKLADLMMALERAVTMNDQEIANILRDQIGALFGIAVSPIEDIKPATTITQGIIDPKPEDLEQVEDVIDGNGKLGTAGKEEAGQAEGEQEQEKDGEAGSDKEGERRKPKPGKRADASVDRRIGTADVDVDGQDGRTGRQDGPTTELGKAILGTEAKFALENTDPDRKGKGFTDKIKALLDAFEETVSSKLEAIGEKIKFSKKKLLPMLYDRPEWVEKFADEAFPFTVEAFERGEELGAVDLQQAGVAFEATLLPTERVEAQVKRLTRDFASEVVDVIGDDVFKAVKDGLAAEENVYGIAKRIAAVYGEKRDNAAERIARTEVNRALNAGAQETWKVAGVGQNEWLASVDACEFCTAMNGKRVALGAAFLKAGATMRGVDGGSYTAKYGDVLHPTLHPHCTCALVPVVE
jgi:HK97 family phage portal protein